MTLTDIALDIRARSEQFLYDQCTIRSYTGFATVDGEYIEQSTDVLNVPCRIINKTGKNSVSFQSQDELSQMLVNVQTTMMQLPFDVNVSVKDKIVFNSVLYEIVYVPVKHALMGAFIIGLEKHK